MPVIPVSKPTEEEGFDGIQGIYSFGLLFFTATPASSKKNERLSAMQAYGESKTVGTGAEACPSGSIPADAAGVVRFSG